MSSPAKDRVWSRMGREIEHELTLLNDQFCFFLFLEYQFFDELPAAGTTGADQFTTDAFKGNRYASKIHVQVRDLPSFRNAHRGASFGAYFTNSYEVAASFAERALGLLQETSRVPLILPARVQEGPEIYYQRTLRSWGYSPPAPRLIDTLSFFRHRRNALTHLHKTPGLPYTRLVRRLGNALNAFWTRARVQIDFRQASTGALTERETLDLLKLMRIVIQRLDAHFISIIDVPGIVRSEANRLFGSKKVRMNKYVAGERIQKLRYEITSEFGVSPPESLLRAAAETVGTK